MPQFCILFYAILQSWLHKGGGMAQRPLPKYAPVRICTVEMIPVSDQQRWSPRGRPWPRGHIFKSLALVSKPTSPQNCPVLGSRTALFFDSKKKNKQTKNNISDCLSIRCFFSLFEK